MPNPSPKHNDRPFDEIVTMGNDMLQSQGYTQVFLKWTCPTCGERCMSDIPNEYSALGYVHTERADGTPCGTWYKGENGYGIMGIMSGPGTDIVEALKHIQGRETPPS